MLKKKLPQRRANRNGSLFFPETHLGVRWGEGAVLLDLSCQRTARRCPGRALTWWNRVSDWNRRMSDTQSESEVERLKTELEASKAENERLRDDLKRFELFQSLRERFLKHVEHSLNNPVQGIILSIEAMSSLIEAWTIEMEAKAGALDMTEVKSAEEDVASTGSSTTGREDSEKDQLFAWHARVAEFGSMTELALSAVDNLHVTVSDMYDGLICGSNTSFSPMIQPTNIYWTMERCECALQYHSAAGLPSARLEAESRNKLSFDVQPGLLTCMTDTRWLFSMTLKLVGNARRFCSIDADIEVVVSAIRSQGTAEHPMLCVEVRDKGQGVDPSLQDLLFSVDAASSEYHGFGLYILANKVKALNGECGYKPNNPRGSIFWFQVPYKTTTKAPTSRAGPQYLRNALQPRRRERLRTMDNLPRYTGPKSETSSLPSHSKRVLVIEDEEIQRKLLCKQLSLLSYEVFEACDGAEGLEQLKARSYALVLCDKLMPRMNGDVCVREFRKWELANRNDISQQFICGLSATKECELPEGYSLYLPKPIRRRDLMKVLRPGKR